MVRPSSTPDEHYVTCICRPGALACRTTFWLRLRGPRADYYLQDGALVPERGRKPVSVMLERVMPDAAGIYVVPEDVVSVKAGALDGCTQVEALVLPTGRCWRNWKRGCFFGRPRSCARVVPGVDRRPMWKEGHSDTETKAVVVPDARAAYERAWGAVLGDGQVASLLVASAFELREVNGFAILAEPEGSVLLRAPADVERFDERLLGGVEVSAVNAHAFRECAQLWLAELPSSVRSIGREAFEGCTSLEAFYAHAPGTVERGFWRVRGLRCLALRRLRGCRGVVCRFGRAGLHVPGLCTAGGRRLSRRCVRSGRATGISSGRTGQWGASVRQQVQRCDGVQLVFVQGHPQRVGVGSGGRAGCVSIRSGAFSGMRGHHLVRLRRRAAGFTLSAMRPSSIPALPAASSSPATCSR